MDASRIRKKKFAFSQISGYVWTTPKRKGKDSGEIVLYPVNIDEHCS